MKMKSKNVKILAGSLVIVSAIVLLLVWATPSSTGVELKIQDVLQSPTKYNQDFISLQGNLKEETVKWNPDKIELRFTIQDDSKSNQMPVVYKGVKPDTFTEGTIVIVEGQYDKKDGQFIADRVKTRCPSKYEGQTYDPKLHEDLKKMKTPAEQK